MTPEAIAAEVDYQVAEYGIVSTEAAENVADEFGIDYFEVMAAWQRHGKEDK